MSNIRIALIAAMIAAAALPAAAKTWQVKMLNQGADGMPGFQPAFVAVKPGDTIKFLAADKGHNAEAMPSMIPAGTTAFKGKTDEEIAVKLTTPGLYAFKCKPHISMGMVGLIEVGAAKNKAQIATASDALPPMAKKAMTALLARAK